MRITLLCNCGLAVECSGAVLLVDVPNGSAPPFYRLPADAWQRIVERQPPYDRLAGIYITHQHGIGDTRIPFLSVIIDESDANRRTYKIARQRGASGSYAMDILKKYGLTRQALETRFQRGQQR